MDPLRIAVRVVFVYVLLHIYVRLAGKRSVKHAGLFDFILAIIAGDLVDDVIWAEVSVSTFVAAAASLLITHVTFEYARFKEWGAVR